MCTWVSRTMAAITCRPFTMTWRFGPAYRRWTVTWMRSWRENASTPSVSTPFFVNNSVPERPAPYVSPFRWRHHFDDVIIQSLLSSADVHFTSRFIVWRSELKIELELELSTVANFDTKFWCTLFQNIIFIFILYSESEKKQANIIAAIC